MHSCHVPQSTTEEVDAGDLWRPQFGHVNYCQFATSDAERVVAHTPVSKGWLTCNDDGEGVVILGCESFFPAVRESSRKLIIKGIETRDWVIHIFASFTCSLF